MTDAWKWPLVSDFNVRTCISEFSLYLSLEDLEKYTKYYTPNPRQGYTEVRALLEELEMHVEHHHREEVRKFVHFLRDLYE